MTYDATTGTAVMFGGANGGGEAFYSGTWTWDGTTWTKQHPATSPPAREGAAMAYDAATGTAVLFGGTTTGLFGDTWTWDGTTWTKQHPAISPPARDRAAMAYDPATGTVVLFGGSGGGFAGQLGDTWTWDGTTWTKQHPGTSPPARSGAAMAYDAATGTAVMFGGDSSRPGHIHAFNDTWTWDGTTWTKQHPATSPPARSGAAMAYDAATGSAVLNGGIRRDAFNGTFTWDGTTWTKQLQRPRPPARWGAGMAYDAATSRLVMFGGAHPGSTSADRDTWTWG